MAQTRELAYEALGFVFGAIYAINDILLFRHNRINDPVLEQELANIAKSGLERAAKNLEQIALNDLTQAGAMVAIAKRLRNNATYLNKRIADFTIEDLRTIKSELELIKNALEAILFD